MTTKQKLLCILLQKINENPEDEALAEYYAEINGDCYSENAMFKVLERLKNVEKE